MISQDTLDEHATLRNLLSHPHFESRLEEIERALVEVRALPQTTGAGLLQKFLVSSSWTGQIAELAGLADAVRHLADLIDALLLSVPHTASGASPPVSLLERYIDSLAAIEIAKKFASEELVSFDRVETDRLFANEEAHPAEVEDPTKVEEPFVRGSKSIESSSESPLTRNEEPQPQSGNVVPFKPHRRK